MFRGTAKGLVALAALALPASATASTITVTGTGSLESNNGICSLVEAIKAANDNAASGAAAGECAAGQAAPTVDVIAFSLAGAGPHVIAPATALPAVTAPVTIDGSTEPDEVRLDGTDTVATGLAVAGDDITIDELTVVNFTTAGVELSGSTDAVLRDSFIGTDVAGAGSLGNGDGVALGGGGATTGATVRDNVISGNTTEGVAIAAGASDNELTGNRIGTNAAGNAALPNGQEGIELFDGDANTIGGDEAGDMNLISGNGSAGVRLVSFGNDSERATENVVEGNRIGTRLNGEVALGNGGAGVSVGGAADSTEIRDNQIAANAMGITVDDSLPLGEGATSAQDTVIAGNLIGTDDDGVQALGNTTSNVQVAETNERGLHGTLIGGSAGLTPGGACTGDCNVIAASTGSGIRLEGGGGTSILGNHIGVDVAGNASLPNADSGVDAIDVTDDPIAANVISGNGGDGVLVVGNEPGTSTGVAVQGNLIGVASDGEAALGNGESGVQVAGFASETAVGGAAVGEGNVIANNTDEGVTISEDATDNPILSNAIFGNDDLGIDVGNNSNDVNDPADADTGANDGQNFPELAFAATTAGEGAVVAGRLHSVPDSSFRVELFANDTGDPLGRGQGEVFLGAFDVTTGAEGDAVFAEPTGEIELGTDELEDDVSATATELGPSGEPLSTSEFSLHIETRTCEVPATGGDDTLTGNGPGDDVVCGLGGDDVFIPDGGGDLFIGGDGTDESSYEAAADAIEADLETGFVGGPGTAGDFLSGVENLVGSDFDDLILGNGLSNFVQANDGRDTVEGFDGDDTLKGGVGGDTIKGGDGDDEILSQDGGDVLKGQSGDDDDLSAGPGKDELNGGSGNSDHCNGGGNDDETPARGCESTSSIP